MKKKKYVPEDWIPLDWNEVVTAIVEIVKKGKVDKKKLNLRKIEDQLKEIE